MILNKKNTNGPKANKKKEKSEEERRDEIMDAINQVVEKDDTKNPEALQQLLISTAFLENSLGANKKAYNRDYTNSQWSIDENFLNDILTKSGFAVDEFGNKTDQLRNNNYNKFLQRAGYDPGDSESMDQFVEDLKNDNALTGAYMARLKYSLNPDAPLPDLTKESIFNAWYSDYNSGGVDKDSEEYNKLTNTFDGFYEDFFKQEVSSETEDDGPTGMRPVFMDKGTDIFSPGSLI
jgi:hypothetical protein